MEVLELVDAARGRPLVTHVYAPAGDEPAPLVVFGHGLYGHPQKFTRLFGALAGAGYLVAAPTFPYTNELAPGGVVRDDVREQPRDMTFVLDAMLDGAVARAVDATRIAFAGLSLGAATVLAAVYARSVRDARVRAAVAMAGRLHALGGGYEFGGVPLFVLHGARDHIVPYAEALDVYEQARPPKAMLTLHVDGHASPFEDEPSAVDTIVDAATVAFLDLALGRGDRAQASVRLDAAAPSATLVRDGI